MNQIAKIPLRQVTNVKQMMLNENALDQLSKVAMAGMRPEQLTRHLLQCLHKTPKLGECDPFTVLDALMTCAQFGFVPNTPTGAAYLIPYGKTCQLILGYKGLMTLAMRSGEVKAIQSGVATKAEFESGDFDFQHGSESYLKHRATGQDSEAVFAWAHAAMVSGGEQFVVLPWTKVLSIRDGSSGWQRAVQYNKTKNSPWFTHEREMGEKTAIRALCKKLPLSPKAEHSLDMALTADEARGQVHDFGFPTGPAGDEGETIDGTADDAPPNGRKQVAAEDQSNVQNTHNAPASEGKAAQGGKKQPAGKKPAPEKAPEPEQEDDAGLPPEMASIVQSIEGNLETATTPQAIDELEITFEVEINLLRNNFPDAHQELTDAIEAKRSELAGD